jgi:uncharacterized membrane protein HdeD (DUF308 family)
MSHPATVFDLTIDPSSMSASEIRAVRAAMAFGGVMALVLGVIVLAWPSATLTIVAVLFGLYFLIGGVARVARGAFMTGAGGGIRVLNILFGVLLVIAGIIAIRNPVGSLAVLGMVVGISWLVEGVAALVETAPDSSRWAGTLFGAISVIAGIVVLLSPVDSLATLILVGGIFLLVSGIMQLATSFTFGRGAKAPAMAG